MSLDDDSSDSNETRKDNGEEKVSIQSESDKEFDLTEKNDDEITKTDTASK